MESDRTGRRFLTRMSSACGKGRYSIALMHRIWFGLGSFAGLTAVMMAAVSAHGLRERLDPAVLQSVGIAVQMHGWHALALLACGIWRVRDAPRLVDLAATAFALGLLLFCSAVYAPALAGIRLPMAAPAGGIMLMGGWVVLGLAAAVPTR